MTGTATPHWKYTGTWAEALDLVKTSLNRSVESSVTSIAEVFEALDAAGFGITSPGQNATPSEVYLVQRENFDGTYVFEREEDADAYAALFPEADQGMSYVIDPDTAADMIAEEQAD